jgi:hypothetical protein
MNICTALLFHQVLETTHSNTAIFHAATGTQSAAGVSAATVIHRTNVSAAEQTTHTNTHAAAVKGRVRVGGRERWWCVFHMVSNTNIRLKLFPD